MRLQPVCESRAIFMGNKYEKFINQYRPQTILAMSKFVRRV